MTLPSGWRVRDLADEAVRRMGGMHVAVALSMTAVLGTSFVATALELRSAFAAELAAQVAGLDVAEVTVGQESWLDAAECEHLAQAPGVVAAGASLGENTALAAAWAPSGLPVPLIDLTPGALRTWWPEYDGSAGVFVGRDLSQVRGLAPGMALTIAGEPVTVTGRLPASAAPDILQSAVVRVVPARGRAQTCWIRMPTGTAAAAEPIAMTLIPDTPMLVTPFLDPDTRPQIVNNLTQSATRHAWVPTAAAGLAILGFLGIARRREVGIYRATGTRWPALNAMHGLQVLILAWPALLLVATAGTLGLALAQPALPLSADVLWYLLQPLLVATLIWLALGPLMLRLAGAGAIVDALDR